MINSVLIYSLTYFSSVLMAKAYEALGKNRNLTNINRLIWAILIILPPSILAYIRTNVGTDYNSYVNLYNIYKYINIQTYISQYLEGSSYLKEPGFYLINRLSYLLFNNVRMMFFICVFLQMAFVWAGINYYKKYLSISFSLFIYYLISFNSSFNIVRQTIAVAIIFYAIRYVLEKKFLKYILLVLMASLFHQTALFFIIIYFLNFNISNKNEIKKILYYMVILLTPISVYMVIYLFEKIGVATSYIDTYNFSFSRISIGFLLFILPAIIPIFIFKKYINRYYLNFEMLANLSLLQIPLRFLTYYSQYAGRLEEYISILQIIIIPILIRNSVSKKKSILNVYYIFWYILMYILIFVISNSNGTYPFIT